MGTNKKCIKLTSGKWNDTILVAIYNKLFVKGGMLAEPVNNKT